MTFVWHDRNRIEIADDRCLNLNLAAFRSWLRMLYCLKKLFKLNWAKYAIVPIMKQGDQQFECFAWFGRFEIKNLIEKKWWTFQPLTGMRSKIAQASRARLSDSCLFDVTSPYLHCRCHFAEFFAIIPTLQCLTMSRFQYGIIGRGALILKWFLIDADAWNNGPVTLVMQYCKRARWRNYFSYNENYNNNRLEIKTWPLELWQKLFKHELNLFNII